ncbi:MAG: hypothetical protein QW547_02585 [Candidatus Bathyarchaeia archaeon]
MGSFNVSHRFKRLDFRKLKVIMRPQLMDLATYFSTKASSDG